MPETVELATKNNKNTGDGFRWQSNIHKPRLVTHLIEFKQGDGEKISWQ